MLLDVTTGGQVAEETGEAIQQVDVSILELILEGSSGIGGGAVMILLALMSIAAIYLFFERTMAIAKAEKVSPDFMNKIRDYIGQGSFDSARNLCQSSNTPMARMLDKGISRIGKDLKDISVSIENIGKLEIYNLEKRQELASARFELRVFMHMVMQKLNAVFIVLCGLALLTPTKEGILLSVQ